MESSNRCIQRLRHGEVLSIAHHDARQGGQASLARLEVNRFDIKQGITDRNNQKIALKHLRSAPIPQAELFADLWILIDQGLHLFRTEDR